jgi:hypothetical protein
MANVKISALVAASALDGTEELPVVQGATTVKATIDQILAAAPDEITLTGDTAILASHHDKVVRCTATGVMTFAVAATSGATRSGVVSIYNASAAGVLSAAGVITAPPGYKLWAGPGEWLIATYDLTADAYKSVTQIPAVKNRGEYSTFATPTAFSAGTLQIPGNPTGSAQIDSSTTGSVAWAVTNKYTGMVKIANNGAAAAISRLAGMRGPTPGASSVMYVPTAATDYGWRIRIVGAIADANAAGQFGLGLHSVNPAWTAAAEPSAMVNCLFLGGDAADAQLSIMHNNAAGACTKIPLNGGTGFPNNTNATDMYSVEFAWDGLTDILTYRAENLITNIVAVGTITGAERPVAATPLSWFACRGSANVATTPVIHISGMAAGDFLR